MVTPLGVLGYAFNISVEICYNEVSTLTFSLPGYVDNKKTPHYDDVVGMRIIDLKGVGQFIVTNPKITNDGIKEIKECSCFSLEYELTYKKIFFENATYNFWNPVAPEESVLKIILDKIPSWSLDIVDADLVGRFRTFEINGENLYNFIKSTLQETYQCIFEFDTYDRKIKVRSVTSPVTTEPVFISLDNLIKQVEIEENSENIITCLDVNGADGVSIRSINPTGENKIYNLDYFMNTTDFTQTMINKYNSWKTTFESYQLQYSNLSGEHLLLDRYMI